MSEKKPITATMADCLDVALEHGGKLVRYSGTLWSWPDVPRKRNGRPVEFYRAQTVAALVKRNRMLFAQWRYSKRARLPMAAVVKMEPAE